MDEAWEKAVMRKVAWRLIPLLFLLYMVNILDRVNVSFARLQMLDDLQMSAKVYGRAAGIFYIGYLIFEVPSNLILRRTGARRWIARILVSWGVITCSLMTVRQPWSFYLLRILLGFAEAGFFPGIILYLTYWFPARERARAVACFMAASPLTGVLGGPLSGGILEYMDQVGGLRGWQWIFLLEGLPAVFLGFVVLYYLVDRPEQAGWLAPEERAWLAARIAQEEAHREQRHGLTLLEAMSDPRVWLLTLLYFTIASGANGMGFYLPKLIQSRFPHSKGFQIGLLTAVPNLCAALCMVLNAVHSDRTGERRLHVALPALLATAGLLLSISVESPFQSLCAFALVQMGIMSMIPVFWSLPTAFLSGAAAAGGIALINSVGNLGGYVAPEVMGQVEEDTGGFDIGLLAIAATLFVGAILARCVRREHPGETKPP